MLATTVDVIRAGLKADPTLNPTDRIRLMTVLRNGGETETKKVQPSIEIPRLLSRKETSNRLNKSLRTIDKLAAAGILRRRKFPGRKRGCGFLESDVNNLIMGDLHATES